MTRLSVRVPAQLPEVGQPRVGPLDRPAESHRLVLLHPARRAALALFGDHRVGDVALGQTLERGLRVVAAVEPERLDLLEETHSVRVVEGRCEHHRVVAVGTVDGDTDGDAIAVREDGPLPAELAPISRVGPRSLTATRALVQRAVDGDVVEAESDDLVVRRLRLRLELVEHPCCDPLVPSSAHRRVGDLVPTQPLGVLPRTPRDEPDEHHRKAVSVGLAPSVHPERMRVDRHRDQRLERRPHDISHFGCERAHDGGDLHSVVGGWNSTPIVSGPPPRPVDGQLSASGRPTPWSGAHFPIRAASKLAIKPSRPAQG